MLYLCIVSAQLAVVSFGAYEVSWSWSVNTNVANEALLACTAVHLSFSAVCAIRALQWLPCRALKPPRARFAVLTANGCEETCLAIDACALSIQGLISVDGTLLSKFIAFKDTLVARGTSLALNV